MSSRLSTLARNWTNKTSAWGAVTAAAAVVAARHPREVGDGDGGDALTCSLLVDGQGEVTSSGRGPSYVSPGGFLLPPLPQIGASQTSTTRHACYCESSGLKSEDKEIKRANIQRSRTMRILSSKATQNRKLSDVYDVNFDTPLGEVSERFFSSLSSSGVISNQEDMALGGVWQGLAGFTQTDRRASCHETYTKKIGK